MERIKETVFCLLIFILLLSACSKKGKEGKWYTVKVGDIKYQFMISSSVYTLPVPIEGFNRLVVGPNWDVKNVSEKNATFFWDQLYLIDSNEIVYFPFYGRIDGGSSYLTPGSTCYGSASFQIPESIDINILECGIIGDKNEVRIKLKPRDRTEELKQRLGISY